ncbi:MAG TPA: HD domain-containing phosphohydrolase [Patescibacteria group bacterium]|nr:HD domain-containing phosphohydrolase [Patescibacteria group bacterium]
MPTVLEALPTEYKKFKDFIASFAKLVFQRRLFPSGHPSIKAMLEVTHGSVTAFLQQKDRVELKLITDRICYLNFEMDLVRTDSGPMHLFRETLRKLSVGEIQIQNGVSKDEMLALADLFVVASKNDRSADISSIWSRIRNIRISHGRSIVTGQLPDEKPCEQKTIEQRFVKRPRAVQRESAMHRIVDGVLQNLEKLTSAQGRQASNKILELVENENQNPAAILLLNSLRSYDDYTFSHSVNVAVIAAAIARQSNCSEQEIDGIALAGLMHDIGKVYVPCSIVHKTGKLTPREWQYMKMHPVNGEKILREEGVGDMARRVAYEHHMRYDFCGYPVAKNGYQMLQASHIVRIADSYDALTTKRPYRKQISPYEAIKLMVTLRGKEFHPRYLDIFLYVLGNIPIGSILRLTTGEMVLVVDVDNKRGDLPRVRVLKDAEGLDVKGEVIYDLNEKEAKLGGERSIIADIIDNPVRDVDVGKYMTT